MNETKVALPLSKRDKTFVMIGSCIFMFFMAANGTAIAISQKFLLESINGIEFFALASIFVTLGTTIMTPIGGSLGTIFGRKNLMVVSGILALVTTVGIVYSSNIYVYLGFIIANGLAKGAFTATPYILMSLINEKKDIPKAMGMMASSVSAGTLVASLLSGVFNDMGQTALGIIVISLTVLPGVAFIFMGLPNEKSKVKVKIDLIGILLLVVTISAFVLSFNYGSILGWTSPMILAGFATLLISGTILVVYETKVERSGGTPIIYMSLFKNMEYVVMLIVGITLYYYQVVMTNYGTLAAIEILGVNATVAGTLTIPRTIITLVLPTFFGVWITKKRSNSWISMALASILLIGAFALLLPISPSMSISMFFIAFSLTGITESFRAVSTLPAAQAALEPEQMAHGTSTVSFVNTLAPVLSATISGAVFNASGGNIQIGMRNIFIVTIIVSVIGLALVLFYIRPKHAERYSKED